MNKKEWVCYTRLDFVVEMIEDRKILENMLKHDPFGKMGCGAPLRDARGHIMADRGNIFDREPINFYHQSPKDDHKEDEFKNIYTFDFSPPNQKLEFDEMETHKYPDSDFDKNIFLEWSEKEKERRDRYLKSFPAHSIICI